MAEIRVRFSKGSESLGTKDKVTIQVPAAFCDLADPFDDVATISMPLVVAEWLAKLLQITVTEKIDTNALVDL